MKVEYKRTVYEELDLSNDTVNDITIRRLYRFLDGGEYLREENGKTFLKMDDPHWRHGSVSEVTVREATKLDIAVCEVISAIQKEYKRNVFKL